MIELDKPIVLSSTRAIVGFDPDSKMAVIDSNGLRMSSLRFIGEFDIPDDVFDKIQSFEKSMSPRMSEAFCATGEKGAVKNDCPPPTATTVQESVGLSGRQKAILERWKDYP